jgi:hypothetical protein
MIGRPIKTDHAPKFFHLRYWLLLLLKSLVSHEVVLVREFLGKGMEPYWWESAAKEKNSHDHPSPNKEIVWLRQILPAISTAHSHHRTSTMRCVSVPAHAQIP